MITFAPFWRMMKERCITEYDLEYNYGLNPEDISRLKHNHNYTLRSISRLCELLDCKVEDIIEYEEDKKIAMPPLNT